MTHGDQGDPVGTTMLCSGSLDTSRRDVAIPIRSSHLRQRTAKEVAAPPDEVRAVASRAVSDDERQAFAVPFAEGEYDDIELSLLDRD
ncbi:MAG: hypothetical protein M3256_25735, partial [Actinomycetota bacterium]|nr:hypothetical protein [Actinomycetota bacterium]